MLNAVVDEFFLKVKLRRLCSNKKTTTTTTTRDNKVNSFIRKTGRKLLSLVVWTPKYINKKKQISRKFCLKRRREKKLLRVICSN